MTDANFEYLRRLARENTGIELSDHKKEMIYSRLVRRIRMLKMSSFDSYCRYLAANMDKELTDFINAITTNLTSFFRENHHFEYLRQTVLPELKERNRHLRKVRIWSAGCSTGEEAYSLAMILSLAGFDSGWELRVMATDLDSSVITHAKAGVYAKDRFEHMSPDRMQRFFTPSGDGAYYTIKPSLAQMVTFRQMNLLQSWPIVGPFDLIFCRNVVIYFSKETQHTLFDRFAGILAENGYLFIGHSESLHGVSDRFESLGRTIYRKVR